VSGDDDDDDDDEWTEQLSGRKSLRVFHMLP
jgi:hypothetical protein